MNELLNELMVIAKPAIVTMVTVIFGFVGNKIRVYYNLKISKEQQEQIAKIAHASVLFVEQVTGDYMLSEDKLSMAKHRAMVTLKNIGVDVTDEELTMWIESFVNGLNNGGIENGEI